MSAPEQHREYTTGVRVVELLKFSLPIVLVWAVPVLIAVACFVFSAVQESTTVLRPGPETVKAGSTSDEVPTPVTLTATRDSPVPLRSRTSGIVTSVSSAVSAQLEPGDNLMSVGDMRVRAQVGPSPIVSDVGPESNGADVERVSHLLAETTYLDSSEVTRAYTWELRKAIDKWNEDVGVPTDGVFRVSTTVFVPEDARPLDRLTVTIADQVTDGAEIGSFAAEVEAVSLAPATDAPLSRLAGIPVKLRFGEREFNLPELNGIAPDDDLLEFLSHAVAEGNAQQREMDQATAYEGGRLVLAEPRRYATVPTGSVYVGTSGTACVFTALGDGDYRAQPVPDARPLGASGTTAIGIGFAGDDVASSAVVLPESVLDSCA